MTAVTLDTTAGDDVLAACIARRDEGDRARRAAVTAFEHLHERHSRLLSAFLAARARRGDVDDLLQDVWRRVWEHLPAGFHGGNFRAWLHQVARNTLIDHGRKSRPEPLGDDDGRLSGPVEPPERRLIERERTEALRRCLERLDAAAAALVRARLGGEDYEEVCRRLGLKPERAYKLFHHAKTQLQTCVERAKV